MPTVGRASLNSADLPCILLLREMYRRTTPDRRPLLSSCTSLFLSTKIKLVAFKLANFVCIKVLKMSCFHHAHYWAEPEFHTKISSDGTPNTWIKEQVQCLWDRTHKTPCINDYVYVLVMIPLEHILFYDISGQETTPNSWPCLSVFLTGYLTGVVLLAAYSGALVSFLTVQAQGEPPFRGYEGLLNEGSYRLGVTPGAAFEMFRVRKLNALLLK
jgi:hypothetical protein